MEVDLVLSQMRSTTRIKNNTPGSWVTTSTSQKPVKSNPDTPTDFAGLSSLHVHSLMSNPESLRKSRRRPAERPLLPGPLSTGFVLSVNTGSANKYRPGSYSYIANREPAPGTAFSTTTRPKSASARNLETVSLLSRSTFCSSRHGRYTDNLDDLDPTAIGTYLRSVHVVPHTSISSSRTFVPRSFHF